MLQRTTFKIKGMNRDLSESSCNPQFSYENYNIRITPTDDNTLLSLTNERGTLKLDKSTDIKGKLLGACTLDSSLIIFTYSAIDRIYKVNIAGNTMNVTLLYEGHLNFNYSYPIEAIGYFENEEVQKIYWTDGLNQPRVINIAAPEEVRSTWNDTSFDFVRKLKLNETVTIEKNTLSNGSFASGIIQYTFTYFNSYGQESNIFYVSPLYYISYSDRGGSPEDIIPNSFEITINNADKTFDYVRVYSIHRTSLNAEPTVKIVTDLYINKDSETRIKLSYIDTGTTGSIVDPTLLYYVGGEEVVFNTMEHKDNTLFLGNIKLLREPLDKELVDYFKKKEIKFNTSRVLSSPSPTGYYPYQNQLKDSSFTFKTFKYLETYRFGIQFQHKSGKWSDPVWINDVRNTSHIISNYTTDSNIEIPTASFTLNDSDILTQLTDKGYIKARPVVVFPEFSDRECICQGILCPTVYNLEDRYNNRPFVQSSWFLRPFSPYDIEKTYNYEERPGEWEVPTHDYWDRKNMENTAWSSDSRAAVLDNDSYILPQAEGPTVYGDNITTGSWAEFRHNYPLPDNLKRNGEIQCSKPNIDKSVYRSASESEYDTKIWIHNTSDNFYVDQSILTLHSPDLEFNSSLQNLNNQGLELRIVGFVPFTSFYSNLDITNSAPTSHTIQSDQGFTTYSGEFLNIPFNVENISRYGWRGLISSPCWLYKVINTNPVNDYFPGTPGITPIKDPYYGLWAVFPFQREDDLKVVIEQQYTINTIDSKKMSNLKYSYNTYYLDESNIYNFYEQDSPTQTGISGINIFNSNETTLLKIKEPLNSDLGDLNYYGNVDKVITTPDTGDTKDNPTGYFVTGIGFTERNSVDMESMYSLFIKGVYKNSPIFVKSPITMKYKSTPHAVIALNYTQNHEQVILPTIQDGDLTESINTEWVVNNMADLDFIDKKPYWDKKKIWSGISQKIFTIDELGITTSLNNTYLGKSIEYGFLWVGEIFNPNVENRFGGQTDEAFENNTWLPCGDAVGLLDSNSQLKPSITIVYKEGDTYYQRYDLLKTYPNSLEDTNCIVEIASFMCETRTNIDGRYDKNRNNSNNLAISPTNFNLLNPVYSQQNNYFVYRALNYNKLSLTSFRNSITWTKSKVAGSLIDAWTNITLANILDLDGDKGTVNSLNRYNNNIIAFQDNGISQIIYNEQTMLNTSTGVPVELANSGKVSGKRYISNTVGCYNKWAIYVNDNGIYFIDDINKGIYLLNSGLTCLSDNLGFHSWINENSNIKKWNPEDFSNFTIQGDKINRDIYFINSEYCLAYSEFTNTFTSFYSYNKVPYIINIEGRTIAITGPVIDFWTLHEGDYNNFFGTPQPYWVTLLVNPNITRDKIFTNIEYRAECTNFNTMSNTEEPFNELTVWNEYQYGSTSLQDYYGFPSPLKTRFRIHRAFIPRDEDNNRIRSIWLYAKLEKLATNNNKSTIHDITINYHI